jgi:hypothetical protein
MEWLTAEGVNLIRRNRSIAIFGLLSGADYS